MDDLEIYEERTHHSSPIAQRAALVAAVVLVAFLLPSTAHAESPDDVSLGIFVPLQKPQFASSTKPVSAQKGLSPGIGLAGRWGFHRLFAAQFDAYYVSTGGGSTGGNSFSFQMPGASATLLVRPLGRTAFEPSVGLGVAYRGLTGRRMERFDGGDEVYDTGDEDIRSGLVQAVGAVGVAWQSGWRRKSIRIFAEARVGGPPTDLSQGSSVVSDVNLWTLQGRIGVAIFLNTQVPPS